MYLVWLRVAAVLYAVASLTALPAVLYAFPRWRKVCLPAAGLAFCFTWFRRLRCWGGASLGSGELWGD
jgi:hypothetical protein